MDDSEEEEGMAVDWRGVLAAIHGNLAAIREAYIAQRGLRREDGAILNDWISDQLFELTGYVGRLHDEAG